MLPKHHLLIGIIFSLVIYIIFPNIGIVPIMLIFLSSVLIDTDHYLYYIAKKRDFSLINAYNWFYEKRKRFVSMDPSTRLKFKAPILIFHGIEFVLLLSILSFFNKLIFWILIGTIIHLTADYCELSYFKTNIMIKMSQIYVYLTNKSKKDF